MNCVGQPGVDLDADIKSGFSFSVKLIPISDRKIKTSFEISVKF